MRAKGAARQEMERDRPLQRSQARKMLCTHVVVWMRKGPRKFICLSIWYPVSGTLGEVMEPLRGRSLLEDIGHVGRLGALSLRSDPVFLVYLLCVDKMWSLCFLPWLLSLPWQYGHYPHGTVSLNELFLPRSFGHSILSGQQKSN